MSESKISMAERARDVLLREMRRWWKDEKGILIERKLTADPIALFGTFAAYVRRRVTETSMELTESTIDTVTRRILPEFPQFLAVWDRFTEMMIWEEPEAPLQSPRTSSVSVLGDSQGGRGESK